METKMKPLTSLQAERLNKITKLIREKEPVKVTLKDAKKLWKLKSEPAAFYVVKVLSKAGYLKRKNGALTVVECP